MVSSFTSFVKVRQDYTLPGERLERLISVADLLENVKGIRGITSLVSLNDERLNYRSFLRIIETIPSVWHFKLNGFMVYDYKNKEGQIRTGFFILGNHDFGTLTHLVCDVDCRTDDAGEVTHIVQLL